VTRKVCINKITALISRITVLEILEWERPRNEAKTCRNLDLINSTCTIYNTVNMSVLITTNKRIHIISAYFLAAASNKHMHLLTSLYGMARKMGISPWPIFTYFTSVLNCIRQIVLHMDP